MSLYRQKLLDHYQNPRQYGKFEGFTHSAKLENISCGDSITVFLKIEDGQISNITFEGDGCAVAIAAASILCEEMLGKKIEDLQNLSEVDLYALTGPLTISRTKCARLSLESAKAAIVSV